jgi:cellulose biosynthesis protein BcsQ
VITATIRDIAIIIIAIQSIVIGGLLALLVWQVWRLVKTIQTEIKPIIQDTQTTVSTVRGTATFVSDNVVNPVVKTSSKVVGLRRTMQSLTADLRQQRKPVPRVKPASDSVTDPSAS